jgi:16S rRNA (cytosine967-C5)-methyltransferase
MKLPFCDYHILAFLKEFDSPQGGKKPLDLLLSDYFKSHKSLGSKDRKIVGETIYGMVRWKSLIDYTASSPSPLDRLNCYRKLNFDEIAHDLSIPEAIRLGLPEFLYQTLIDSFGKEKGKELCRILNTPAPTTIRANLLKTTREHLLSLWQNKFAITPCKDSHSGIQFTKREPLFSLLEFKQGLFEVQDEASQLVADLVKAKPGDLVLDYCSGSGGKTLAFAPSMKGKGQIYLHDIRPSILSQAKKRLCRAGIQNGQCLLPQHPQLLALKEKCDWVLADVPCSGTGTLRRNPDQKWGIDAAMVNRLTLLQKEIVKEALLYLKPKGKFVYATCSLLAQENEAQVKEFLASYPIELIGEPLSLLPKENGMDGFFAALFIKKESML